MKLQTDWGHLGALDALELLFRTELTLLVEPVSRERTNALNAVDGAIQHLFKDQPPSLQKMAYCLGGETRRK